MEVIDKIRDKTFSMIINEDWKNLNLILEKEPNQIYFFSEQIEQQIKKFINRNEEIFEPVPINPSYFRFKQCLEFVLDLLRSRYEQFTQDFRKILLDYLFPKLKEKIGYYSTLDLFFNAFQSDITKNPELLKKTINFPHILKKLIKENSELISEFFPLVYNKEDYYLGYLLIEERPHLLIKYEKECEELIKNGIFGESPYKKLIQLLKEQNPKLIPILEEKREYLKEDFLLFFFNSKKKSVQFERISKYCKIFEYSFDLFTNNELIQIIKKIIDLGFIYKYDDNNTNWIDLILLEIAWHKKVDLFQDYINNLAELKHLQVLESYFLQRPERIKESTNLIIEKLESFTIDLLERCYNSFDKSNIYDLFKIIIEKNKNSYDKIIKVFFDNNNDYILQFKQFLLYKLREITLKKGSEENPPYYYIIGLINCIYFYYPKYKVDIDTDLINSLFKLILDNPDKAEKFNYVEFLRNNLQLLSEHLQKELLSQLIKNGCVPCLEYYVNKNIDIFSRNIDIILNYQPRDENDSDYYIRPLEYIIRKKYEDKDLIEKIIDRIKNLIPSKRKAELFLVVNRLQDSLDVYERLRQDDLIIPSNILKTFDIYLVQIEEFIEKGIFVNFYEIHTFIETVEIVFNKFNSSELRKREYTIKKNCLGARIDLYSGFYFLQNFDYNQAKEKFQKAFIKYNDLSEIDDKNDFNINLFKINSKVAQFFYENIFVINKFLEQDDVDRANNIIKNFFINISDTTRESNFQLKRHLKSINKLEIDKVTKIISQFKSENPVNICSTPPNIENKRILNDNGDIILEWDRNSQLLKSGSIIISRNVKKYFLEVRFDNKEKMFEFTAKIDSKIMKSMNITRYEIKAGLSSYEITLKSEEYEAEENILIILTENNICGFQIICQIPIIIRNEKDYGFKSIQYKPVTFDDFYSYYDSEITELTQSFCQYEHIEGNIINKDRINLWLRQFETLDGARLALNILKNIDFYNRNRLKSCFEILYRKHLSENRFIISLLGNLHDSSSIMSNIISGDILMGKIYSRSLTEILDRENPEQVSIAFFDDIIQSGKQVRTIFQQWFGLKTDLNEHHVSELNTDQKEKFRKFYIYLLFVYSFKEGMSNIEDLLTKDLHIKHTIDSCFTELPTEKCFSPISRIFYDPKDRLAAEKLCKEIGYQILSDKKKWTKAERCNNSLGYGNKQGLFVTFWNVPTTTLPILWKRGIYNNKHWEPLFLRREKK